ncbi:TetR/AcrR family transcriptional regulator [Paradesulfitobacterium aromaticivorans]
MSSKNWGLEAENSSSKSFQAKTSRGEATRQKLLAAAEEIFGTKGYFRTSVVDITIKAGVAQGTFYVYFPGKKDIFEELVKELSHKSAYTRFRTGHRLCHQGNQRGSRAFHSSGHRRHGDQAGCR